MLSGPSGILIQDRGILKCYVQQYTDTVRKKKSCLSRQFMQLGFKNTISF